MTDFFVENPQEVTERLAYEYWEGRGHPLGSPEVDWFAAERTLALALKHRDLPLSSLSRRYEKAWSSDGPFCCSGR